MLKCNIKTYQKNGYGIWDDFVAPTLLIVGDALLLISVSWSFVSMIQLSLLFVLFWFYGLVVPHLAAAAFVM